MKATFVLIANNEVEYLARKIMLEANKKGNLGFESTRLPQHVSLKQPFKIDSLEKIDEFFEKFAKTLKPIKMNLMEVECLPCDTFGVASGLLWFHVKRNKELTEIHNRLNGTLADEFSNTNAPFDGEQYEFHMTISIGGAPYESYKYAYDNLKQKSYYKDFIFDEIGLFYYDEDDIKPGTYFCYRRIKL